MADLENIRKYMPHLLPQEPEAEESEEGPIDLSKYDDLDVNVDDLKTVNRIITQSWKTRDVREFFRDLIERMKEQDKGDVKFDKSLVY